MSKKQKLELTWIGKDDPQYDPANIEPRILIEDPEKSYGDDNKENMLIHGDNLLALKALEQKYKGKIKCIYIDPPYNTGNAFEYYDDNLEHSIWLSLMKPRLNILKDLLADDGFICCQIDDSEGHYLKVLMDEIFGRANYLSTFYIKVRYADKTLKSDMDFHKEMEQVHVYRKTPDSKPNLTEVEVSFEKYIYDFIEKSVGEELTLGGKRVVRFKQEEYELKKKESGSKNALKEIWASGTILDGNSSGRFFRDYLDGRYNEDGYGALYKVYGIGNDNREYRYFTGPKRIGATKGKYYQGVPIEQLSEIKTKTTPINSYYDLAAFFGNCRQEGGVGFRGGKKPERLLQLLLEYFTDEQDIVLDSFLGSGTTCAVAHKLNRRYIGIELGEHAYELDKPRLDRVIDGDKTGISKSIDWQGGGGYKFYELAPSLLKRDKFNNLIIDEFYNADKLANAMAKHQGFNYEPSNEIYWKQGYSYENDYIFTTTTHLTVEYLSQIHEEMKEEESLLICSKSFQSECIDKFDNIDIKKIPQALLGKCEFARDNYDLNIIDAPILDDDEWEDCDE